MQFTSALVGGLRARGMFGRPGPNGERAGRHTGQNEAGRWPWRRGRVRQSSKGLSVGGS